MSPSTFTLLGASTYLKLRLILALTHLLNDLVQALIPAIYPILRNAYALDFGQIGLITLSFQLTASILQPVVGWYTDRKPMPYSLAVGMTSTGAGLLLYARDNALAGTRGRSISGNARTMAERMKNWFQGNF